MTNRKIIVGILVTVLLFGFAAVEVHAQSTNHVPRLVGSWTNLDSGLLVVFNADGTGSWEGAPFRFGAIDDVIVFIYGRDQTYAWNFKLSNDGRTMLIYSTAYIEAARVLQRRN